MTAAVKQLVVLHQGGEAFPNVSTWNDVLAIAANTESHYDLAAARIAMGLGSTAPLFVVFAADNPFYALFNGSTAVVPTVSTTDGSSAEFSPNQKYLDGTVTKISVIATATTKVTMQFYKS